MHETLPIFYDVAHNPHGIEVALDSLSAIYNEKPIGLIALKADKELELIVPKLKNRFKNLIVTGQQDLGLMDAKDLYDLLINYDVNVTLEQDIIKAVGIINNSVSKVIPGLIFGSHYIGETIYREYGFSFDKGII